MVEPISMAVGTMIGLGGLYGVCLQAMEQVIDAKHFGEDSQSLHSLFECERFLFNEWGEKVRIHDTTAPRHRCLDMSSNEYPIGIESDPGAVGAKQHAAEQQNKLQFRKKVAWAVKDKKGFGRLVADVGAFVQKLYAILHIEGGSENIEAINMKLQDLVSFVEADAHQRIDEMIKQQRFRFEVTAYLTDQTRKDILHWVGAVSTEREYDDAIRARYPGTCTWLFNKETFLNWMGPPYRTSTSSRVLWIHGAPGTGKTFISATAVEHLKSHAAYPTAYFLCSHGDIAKNQPLSIIRSWIVQLARQRVEAFKVLESLKVDEPVETRLWHIFCGMIERVGPCHLVLDGLDECLDYDPNSNVRRVGLLKLFLQELLRSIGSNEAKLLIVSRDIAEIRSGLINCPQNTLFSLPGHPPIEYSITIQDTENDIQSISSSLVQSLKIKNSDKREDTLRKLSERCEGMFLWLRLAGERLKPGMRESKLSSTLESMPTGLNQAYKRDIARFLTLDEADQKWVQRILQWITFAMRPLSVTELFCALAIMDDSEIVQYDDIPDPDDQDAIQTQILDMCGSFLEIRPSGKNPALVGDQTIHFVHFSAKEFLLKGRSECPGTTLGQFFFLAPETSHCTLTHSCLVYLLSNIGEVAHVGLFKYASLAWTQHLHLSPSEGDSQWLGLQRRLFMPGRTCDRWLAGLGQIDGIGGFRALIAASWYNLLDIAREILTNPHKFYQNASTDFGPALLVAAAGGHKEMVELLIAVGANANWRDDSGNTPLWVAINWGRTEVVKVLLAIEDLDVNASGMRKFTTLMFAIRQDNLNVLGLLLARKDVDVNAAYDDLMTPLMYAVALSKTDVVRLLLSREDVCLNTRGHSTMTLLRMAIVLGNHDLVRLLLARVGVAVGPADGELNVELDESHSAGPPFT